MRLLLTFCMLAALGLPAAAARAVGSTTPPPTPKDWADLAKLPDWSGVWTPKISDQEARIEKDPVP